ncbi:MAG: hypothetical protein WBK24_00375 [Dethiobacteria bacterium]|nr:hypothetical protein [Bacillota bacterium]HOA35322.1 hypothetical protein [Bacillota bacterium]HOJ83380.1 hypothetical protein [Bacillota bacterium]HOL14780.1 hypothetical protein [Bacillota bacterium]
MRPQDYLWLLLLSGSYLLFFLLNRKRRKRAKPSRPADRPLTRREQKIWHKLQAAGYRLDEIHPSIPVTMTVDGKKKSFNYEGNFVVSKGGESFLVKLIKGDNPLTWTMLRRELLLDCLFFQTDGVFCYYEERGQLEEVRFAYRSEQGGKQRLLLKAALFLLIIMGIIFLGYLLRDGLF